MRAFFIIFVSIVLEAMPFILLGSFVSGLIQVFVSESWIEHIMPKKTWIGFIIAGLLGVVFPVCECAIVPITRRLVKKGVPIGMATTFMLSVPIVNPVVLLSTYYAFSDKTYMVFARGIFGFLAAITIGVLITVGQEKGKTILRQRKLNHATHDHAHCACGCHTSGDSRKSNPIMSLLEHTSGEFLNISQYLVFGAFLSSLFQIFVDKGAISGIATNPYLSVGFMMGLAFILSICSEVDAFIARTFISQFTSGSILAFLIFGPMLDIKNTMMLLGSFKTKFVLKLILYITLVSYLIGLIANLCI